MIVQGQRAEAEGEGNEVSEAGPEAVAAAQQAMQQYGQEDDENPPNARHLEEMMNAMIEQAYDEEMEVLLLSSCSHFLSGLGLQNTRKALTHTVKLCNF